NAHTVSSTNSARIVKRGSNMCSVKLPREGSSRSPAVPIFAASLHDCCIPRQLGKVAGFRTELALTVVRYSLYFIATTSVAPHSKHFPVAIRRVYYGLFRP